MKEARAERKRELEAMIAGAEAPYQRGRFTFYPSIKKVSFDGRPLAPFSSTHFTILDKLAFRPDRLVTPYELADAISLNEDFPAREIIAKHMQRIRRAISVASRKSADPVATVYGEGYYWKGASHVVDL